MCDVYEVSTRGYHSWKERGLSAHTLKDREILAGIERIFADVSGIFCELKTKYKVSGECIV